MCTYSAKQIQQTFYNYFGYKSEIMWDCYGYGENISLKLALIRKIDLIFNDFNIANGESKKAKIFEAIWDQKNNNSRNCCMLFIDEEARVYRHWMDYVKNNQLHDSLIIAPHNGIYNSDENHDVLLQQFWSPSHKIGSKIVKFTDATANAGNALTYAALLVPMGITVAPAALISATVLGIGCGLYTVARGICKLVDRSKHKQTLNGDDPEALKVWVDITGGAMNIIPAAGLTAKGVSSIAKTGSMTSKVSGAVTKVATKLPSFRKTIGFVSSVNACTNIIGKQIFKKTITEVNGDAVINGFVEYFYNDSYNETETMSVDELEASLFLFTHSIYNFNLAKSIKLHKKKIGEVMDFLIINQRINNCKMTEQTLNITKFVNIYGTKFVTIYSTCKLDIIRSLNIMPENSLYCASMSFDNNDVNDSEIILIATESILNEFHVLSKSNLVAALTTYYNHLTPYQFKAFIERGKSYVRTSGNKIQGRTKRFIPFEQFLGYLFTSYVDYFDADFNMLHYTGETYRLIKEPSINCSICGGKYY